MRPAHLWEMIKLNESFYCMAHPPSSIAYETNFWDILSHSGTGRWQVDPRYSLWWLYVTCFLTRCMSSWLSHCRQGGRIGGDGEDGEADSGISFWGEQPTAASTGGLFFFCWADRIGCTLYNHKCHYSCNTDIQMGVKIHIYKKRTDRHRNTKPDENTCQELWPWTAHYTGGGCATCGRACETPQSHWDARLVKWFNNIMIRLSNRS